MTKWVRIIFISSLALNVILIVGFALFKKSVNVDIYRIGAANATSDVAAARYILQELESGDPERVMKLKQYLRDSIEVGRKEAEEYRSAAE
jgi:hypothetical protein